MHVSRTPKAPDRSNFDLGATIRRVAQGGIPSPTNPPKTIPSPLQASSGPLDPVKLALWHPPKGSVRRCASNGLIHPCGGSHLGCASNYRRIGFPFFAQTPERAAPISRNKKGEIQTEAVVHVADVQISACILGPFRAAETFVGHNGACSLCMVGSLPASVGTGPTG